MDELSISPEELAQVLQTEGSPSPPTSSSQSPPPQSSSSPSTRPDMSQQISSQGNNDVTAQSVQFAPLQSVGPVNSTTNLDMLLGVTLRVAVELGRTKMSIEEILKLGPGSVVELDTLAGEPVNVLINGRLIAKGEVVVIDDRFGVRITDVLPPAQRINSLK